MAEADEIVIKSSKNILNLNFKELYQFRELFFVLAWRDVTVRYKQTILGISWAVFQPLLTTGIFTIFFGKIAKLPSDGLPYPLFTLIGITFWNFFSSGVSNASNSLMSNGGIVSKVYLPRLIIPLAAIMTSGVDFLITFSMMLFALAVYRYIPFSPNLMVFPFLMIILILAMSGFGFFAAALNIRFRDVRYALPFFVQIGFYVTPIIYPLSVVYDYRRYLLMLNPMTAVIEGTREIIRGTTLDWVMLLIGFSVALIIFIIGLISFNKSEDLYVDIS